VSLYDFVRCAKKVVIPKKDTRSSHAVNPDDELNDDDQGEHQRLNMVETAPTITAVNGRGRCSNAQGNFLSSHPPSKSHQIMEMSSPIIPVVLGPTIPHPDKGEAAKELWSKFMLVLRTTA
jgi:hypothetical protein